MNVFQLDLQNVREEKCIPVLTAAFGGRIILASHASCPYYKIGLTAKYLAMKQCLPLLVIVSLFFVDCSKNSTGPDIPVLSDILLEENVTVNPSGYAPLTAMINIETQVPVTIRIEVMGKDEHSGIYHAIEGHRTMHEIPVLGLYANSRNIVRLTFYSNDWKEIGSKEYSVETEALSPDMPQVEVDVANLSQMAEGWTFVSYFGFEKGGTANPQRPFIFDVNGDIRWYLDYSNHPVLGSLFYDDGMERLQNGNLYFGDGSSDKIYEINMFGDILNSWDMPGYGFHHEVTEKPDGNFIATVNKLGADTIEDYLIEIDRESNEITTVWDLNVSLQYSRRTFTNNDEDWFHANAVEYSEDDDCIIVSGRTQGVVKLTRENEVVWIMSPHRGWATSGRGEDLNQYLLQPLDSEGNLIKSINVMDGFYNHTDFEWNWYQHAPQLMPNGNIMLFDNGDNRNYRNTGPYSRAVEYEVNESDMTIQQIWQYGKERGGETYSRIVSDVDYDPGSGHVFFSPGAVHNSSTYGKVVEVDYLSGDVLFEATITPPAPLFIITFHRTERMKIYAN